MAELILSLCSFKTLEICYVTVQILLKIFIFFLLVLYHLLEQIYC